MSYSYSYVLPAPVSGADARAAIERGITTLVARDPRFAGTDLAPRASTAASNPLPIDVRFPAALITAPGRELTEPGAPHDDGYYWCLYELWSDDVETALSISSRRNFNSEAWVTACELLDLVGAALGGEARDY